MEVTLNTTGMIELDLCKTFTSGTNPFELNLSTSIEQGTFVAIRGKSGAGKSTLLRLIAGLTSPDTGLIKVNTEFWFDSRKKTNRRIQNRNIGFVFQDYALFPHLTVLENLKFAESKKTDLEHINRLIEVMEIEKLIDRKPESLSGGQKQRVALARALVRKPQILLLDEPLSALDTEIRIKLQNHIKKLHTQFKLTTLIVTHDQGEILRMADRLIELESGRITADGEPKVLLGNKNLSGKFSFNGEILSIDDQEFISIVTVLVGLDTVKIVLDQNERENLEIGDKVIVASKAFNPILYKL